MFGLFPKKKQVKLTDEQLKWNKMWALWESESIASPYQELMTYDAEVNNGGHVQYFSNMQNCSDIETEMSALCQLLPPHLVENIKKAHQAYLVLEEADDASAEEALAQCDDVFYQSEAAIVQILQEFALRIG